MQEDTFTGARISFRATQHFIQKHFFTYKKDVLTHLYMENWV